MKRVLLSSALSCAVIFGGATAFAQMEQNQGQGQGSGAWQQGQRGQRMSPDQRLQMMTSQLNLTSDQQQQIKPILENESQQMQALHQDSSLSQQDRMSKMRQIRENSASQIKPILTPDQQTKWEQMMSRHRGMGPGGPPPGAAQNQSNPQ